MRCVIVSTGGTIASLMKKGTGYSPELTGQQIRELLPSTVLSGIDVVVDNFSSILSQAMAPADMLRLARRVQAHLADEAVTGVVVTHGTVVMEESAFLCDAVTVPGKPVVFTGAMLPLNVPGSDGLHNLADAIQLACSPQAVGLGAVICMNGAVHAARWARKLKTGAPDAFMSANGFILGQRTDAGIWSLAAPPPRAWTLNPHTLEENVAFLSLVSGSDARLVNHAVREGAKGLVLEGLPGLGAVTPPVAAALPGILDSGVLVALASRSPFGGVRPSSGGSGGSYTLWKMGVLMGGTLSGPKIRLLMMAALGQGMGAGELSALFEDFSEREVSHDA